MHKRSYSFFILISFLLAITIPIVFSDKHGGAISVNENRYLAKFPLITDENNRYLTTLRDDFQAWLNDNLFGRNLAIEAKRVLDYKLLDFPSFNNPIVKAGPNDWLFLLPQYDIPYVVNSNLPTEETIEQLKSKFSALTIALKSRKVELTIMIWPRKYDVYPEELPSTLRRVNPTNGLQILDEYLSQETSFDFKTPLNELISKKKDFPTYSKAADAGHWNAYGAFIGYSQLMQQVKAHIPDVRILTEEDFDIAEVSIDTKFPWGYHSAERDLVYTPRYVPEGVNDNDYFNRLGFESQDPWKSFNYYSNPNKSLPKAIIVGDSYTWLFLLPKLSESFSELVFIYMADAAQVNLLIDDINPDILILAAQGYDSALTFAKFDLSP